jgi:hypothetical protein
MIKEEKSFCSSRNDNRLLFRLLTSNLCFISRLICCERTGNAGNRASSNDSIRSLGNRN